MKWQMSRHNFDIKIFSKIRVQEITQRKPPSHRADLSFTPPHDRTATVLTIQYVTNAAGTAKLQSLHQSWRTPEMAGDICDTGQMLDR